MTDLTEHGDIEAPRLTVRFLPQSGRQEAALHWQTLEAFHGAVVTSSWDWTETWLQRFGDVVEHEFALARRGDEVVGIGLVTHGAGMHRGPLPLATLHLGTDGEPAGDNVEAEPNGVVCDPSLRAQFLRAMVSGLRARDEWDELRFSALPPEDARIIQAAAPGIELDARPCPVMDLDAARQAGGIVEIAPSAKDLRRKLRRAGQLHGEWARDTAHALDILAELAVLHQRRWESRGEPGAFSSARFTGFHRDFVSRSFDRGRVVLYRLSNDQGTLGCKYALVEGRRVLDYQSGMADGELGRLSPGLLTAALCMEACMDHGFEEYDMLTGDSRYKRSLTTAERELCWMRLRRPSIKWALVDRAARFGRAVRRVPGRVTPTRHG